MCWGLNSSGPRREKPVGRHHSQRTHPLSMYTLARAHHGEPKALARKDGAFERRKELSMPDSKPVLMACARESSAR